MNAAMQAMVDGELECFEAVRSHDSVKTDLELTCNRCGELLCDVEAGDSLRVLVAVAKDHATSCDGGVRLQICECFHSCGEDPKTGCSLSGDWHQHANYPCPIHPDAETSG